MSKLKEKTQKVGTFGIHLKRKTREITEGPIFGLIFFKKGQPVAAAF